MSEIKSSTSAPDGTRQQSYVCDFCQQLTSIEVAADYHSTRSPDAKTCDHCKLWRCRCGVVIHPGHNYCHGCGVIQPEKRSTLRHPRCTTTLLTETGWIYRTATASGGKTVCSVWENDGVVTLRKEEKIRGAWIETEVRRLSPEEIELLKG